MKTARRFFVGVGFTLLGLASPAHAHTPSSSYIQLTIRLKDQFLPKTNLAQEFAAFYFHQEMVLQGHLDVSLRDLEYAVGLDSNNDGLITWGEVRARQDAIDAYVLSRLHIKADHTPCTLQPTAHLIDNRADGAYAVIEFDTSCTQAPKNLEIDYHLLFDINPQHRGLLSLNYRHQTRAAVLGPDTPTQQLRLDNAEGWRQFLDFLKQGIWHIWTGYDHIAFLLVLLFPAVLQRQGHTWVAIDSFRPAFINILKIVTAFSAAHSLTLSMAALGLAHLPERLVECAIAASITWGAANNLYPGALPRGWKIAFGFGLMHGFGFAEVLQDLHLALGPLLRALVGFNLGVEIGQLSIVLIFLPIAYRYCRTQAYRRFFLNYGSIAVGALGIVWFLERLFDLRLPI